MAESGRMYNYSNPNFMVAGLIAETVSGVSYRQMMRDQVFDPLGMTRTVFLPSEVLADGDYASGDTYDWTGATQDRRVARAQLSVPGQLSRARVQIELQ